MEYTKSEKGITIVSLVITIIVLLILASISINWGLSSVTQSKDRKLDAELNMMQHAILETYAKNQVQGQVVEQDLPGTKITDYNNLITSASEFLRNLKIKKEEYNNIDNDSYYYEFSTEEQFKAIGMKNSSDTYIVNYKTGEVMNITTPKKSDGTLLYVSNE